MSLPTQPDNRWRPPSFLDGPEHDPSKLSEFAKSFYKELDLAIRIAFENLYITENVVGVNVNSLDSSQSSTSTSVTSLSTRVTAIEANYLATTTAGKKIASGSTSVTGSSTAIATGLATVTNVVGVIDNGTSALNEWLSLKPSATAGAIDAYIWKPTGVADTTPIASITARTVRWIAYGT